MANKKKHHLKKRGKFWYFRKGNYTKSLETTVQTEAIRLRDEMLENYRMTGRYTNEPEEEKSVVFGSIAKKWAKIHSAKVKFSTWKDYRSAMNAHILPYFGDTPIEDIGYMDVENFILTLPCSPKRVNNILVPMRSVFKMAFKEGMIEENVMLKVDNLTLEQSEINPFTYEEVVRILDVINPAYRNYTAARFFTGARSGELDGLKWEDYKLKMKPSPKLYINKTLVCGFEGKPKTKKSKRYIDCLPPVIEALSNQKTLTGDRKNIFYTEKGELMNPDHFREVVWRKALIKAKFDYRPPIQTRHTFATMMITAGEDIGWVQKMLGHSSLQMIFNHYYAWIPQKTRKDGSAFMNSFIEKSDESNKIVSLSERVQETGS
ncbi:MAG: site-specific integrase [Desulfobacter sp.]|nr:MAG: site-specific integrase [Desulfobacter sp.]